MCKLFLIYDEYICYTRLKNNGACYLRVLIDIYNETRLLRIHNTYYLYAIMF